jgi:hypothetical protein
MGRLAKPENKSRMDDDDGFRSFIVGSLCKSQSPKPRSSHGSHRETFF